MVSVERPHYLLFSTVEALEAGRETPLTGGRWRFRLQSADGLTTFAAADDEPDLSPRRLELLAAIRGLEALDRPSRVTLLTPSRYVTRGIRFGVGTWRESNWRWENFGRMSAVRNADLWKRIDVAIRIHQVRCHRWGADSPFAATAEAQAQQPGRTVQWLRRIQLYWDGLRDQLPTPGSALCPQ